MQPLHIIVFLILFPLLLAVASRPDFGYAMIFASMTILKILFVQIAVVLVGGKSDGMSCWSSIMNQTRL